MLYTTAGLLALGTLSHAFPTEMMDALKDSPEIIARATAMLKTRNDVSGTDAAAKIFEPVPIFNAAEQYVDVSPGSGHEFVAPTTTDNRGPCPGLNAMANHGFLPHNGYATIQQFVSAVESVAGMGPGLALFLASYGAVIDGSGTAWSIGGTPAGSNGLEGNGISGSHNKYESDASPMRPDLYQYGNDYKVRVQQFQQLIDLSPQPSNYNIPVLTQFRINRFKTQKAQNPYFFNGPFTGVLVQPAAYTFIYRFMANHSATFPEGLLNRNVLKSWFSITGSDGSFKWTPGHERIPNNWYRRPSAYAYDQSYFLADVKNAAAAYPPFLDIGGNTGTTGSFTGVNVANLSGGVINGGSLAKNNNFACLAYQFAANAKPDLALAVFTGLDNAIGSLTSQLGCPQLTNIDDSQLMQFPGYTRSPAVQ